MFRFLGVEGGEVGCVVLVAEEDGDAAGRSGGDGLWYGVEGRLLVFLLVGLALERNTGCVGGEEEEAEG